MQPHTAKEYFLPSLGSYNNLQTREVPLQKPRANEVLVKVHAVSLQYRDLAISKAMYNIGKPGDLIPCSDMAGEVVSIGEDVQGWKHGDRVCANFCTGHLFGDLDKAAAATAMGGSAQGVLTEYRTFPAKALVKIPAHLSYVQGSTLPCAALTAYNALHGPRPVKAGDYVLILGTGGVSTFGLQFAVASGAIVIATSSSDGKLGIAKKLGAHHLINYRNTPEWDEEVLRITGGVGVDHVVEVGGQGTLPRSIKSVRYGGYVHIIGHIASQAGENANFVGPVVSKAINIRGIYIGPVSQFKNMNRLIEANPEKTLPVVDKVFPFEEAASAYAHLESQKHVGKVVIQVAKE